MDGLQSGRRYFRFLGFRPRRTKNIALRASHLQNDITRTQLSTTESYYCVLTKHCISVMLISSSHFARKTSVMVLMPWYTRLQPFLIDFSHTNIAPVLQRFALGVSNLFARVACVGGVFYTNHLFQHDVSKLLG